LIHIFCVHTHKRFWFRFGLELPGSEPELETRMIPIHLCLALHFLPYTQEITAKTMTYDGWPCLGPSVPADFQRFGSDISATPPATPF